MAVSKNSAGRLDAEALIIGGGPAGSAAAIVLAQAGLRVMLLDAPHRGGAPRPGEALHPGMEPLLGQLGLAAAFSAAGFTRYPGHHVEWGADRQFVPFGKDASGAWQGFQAWRAVFDPMLRHHAEACGAIVQRDCRALELEVDSDGRPACVITGRGPLRAGFVIDASGNRAWLARRLGLTLRQHSPKLVAWFAYIEGASPAPEAPLFTADPEGWTWRAGVTSDLVQWVRLRFDSPRLDRHGLSQALKDGELRHPPAGADVSWREAGPAAGKGYFLVGDAACRLDPSSSHGVLRAVMSGMMAGHAVRRHLLDRLPLEQVVVSYRRWLETWFRHDLEQLRAHYARHPQAPAWCRAA